MIASFRNNFVFIKTRKTAGTSVEIFLSRFCGEEDIITPITPEDELLRKKSGALVAQNYANTFLEIFYKQACAMESTYLLGKLLGWSARRGRWYNHMPATAVKRRLPPDFWASSYKFTIERHPYEKVVSLAHFIRKRSAGKSFAELIEYIIKEKSYINYQLYTDQNKNLLVDRVIDYDNLHDEMNDVLKRIHISSDGHLPRAKGSFRADRTAASEILDAGQKRQVREDAGFEFDLMGYK